jgi:hypothetical protein
LVCCVFPGDCDGAVEDFLRYVCVRASGIIILSWWFLFHLSFMCTLEMSL